MSVQTPNQALQLTAGRDSFILTTAHRCPAAAELGRSAAMNMADPEADIGQRLVRRDGSELRLAFFIRFADGSGAVLADETFCSFELDQATWRRKWLDLLNRGYVAESEAIRTGLASKAEITAAGSAIRFSNLRELFRLDNAEPAAAPDGGA